MAKIPTYVAQRGLEVGSAHRVNVDLTPFKRIEQLGSAISSAGSSIMAGMDRAKAKEDGRQKFIAQQQYNTLQTRLGNELDEAAANIQGDGAGFHDQFKERVSTARNNFLGSIENPELREQFALMSEADVEGFSGKAAVRERDHGVKFYTNEIANETDGLVQRIDGDPVNFGDYVQQGSDLIAAAPGIPSIQKAELDRQWRATAALTYANRLIEDDASDAISALGFGAPAQRYDYMARSLQPIVEGFESGGDAFAMSPKGAIGLMQVMPDTAKEIAAELGDANYPTTGLADEQRYLVRPDVSRRYGTHYLTKQLTRYSGDVEAALIAYNAGPGNADKWIAAGRDYAALPKRGETEPYVQGILAKMGSGRSIMPDDGTVYDAQTFQSEHFTAKDFQSKDGSDLRIKKSVVDFADALTEQTGLQLKIMSGHRSGDHNVNAGGAKHSRHVAGDAIDLDLSGMGPEQRAALLSSALQMGVRGVGLYPGDNSIHLDLRPDAPRAWFGTGEGSYSTIRERASGVSWDRRLEKTIERYPEWAKGPMQQYFREDGPPIQPGTFSPTASNVDPRLAVLSPSKRQSLAASAETKLAQQQAKAKRDDTAIKIGMENRVADDIASIEGSGVEIGVNEAEVLNVLGEKRHAEWQRDRNKARLYYNATQDLAQLNDFELDARVERELKPQAGKRGYADQVDVQARVRKEVETLRELRIKDPAIAVASIPEVKAAWDAYVDKDPEERTAEDMVRYIDASRAAQLHIGIEEGAQNFIPREWAQRIATSIRQGGAKGENPNSYIRKIMGGLETMYGSYADDVLMEAMTEIVKDEELTPLATSILKKMAVGDNLTQNDRAASDMIAEDTAAKNALGRTLDFLAWPFDNPLPNVGRMDGSGPTKAKAEAQFPEVPQEAVDLLKERWREPAIKEYFRQKYGDDAFEIARKGIEGK